MSITEWSFICPDCRSAALAPGDEVLDCAGCGHQVRKENGVWPCFTNAQVVRYAEFLETYADVRTKEGRGHYDGDVLRALPDCQPSLPMGDQWKIRARSYVVLMQVLRAQLAPAAKILDLGAGTGWLSNRLAEAGYLPCAIDLSTHSEDGLGAALHFEPSWPRLQAEFDALPLPDQQVDAVIFNASFHYCTDQRTTIAESLRVLRRGGLLIILDSPVYADASSGDTMKNEQQQYFQDLIGRRSDSINTTGYLTRQQLDELGEAFNLRWNTRKPWYGLRWWLRPWLSKIRNSREPATFAIISAKTP